MKWEHKRTFKLSNIVAFLFYEAVNFFSLGQIGFDINNNKKNRWKYWWIDILTGLVQEKEVVIITGQVWNYVFLACSNCILEIFLISVDFRNLIQHGATFICHWMHRRLSMHCQVFRWLDWSLELVCQFGRFPVTQTKALWLVSSSLYKIIFSTRVSLHQLMWSYW